MYDGGKNMIWEEIPDDQNGYDLDSGSIV